MDDADPAKAPNLGLRERNRQRAMLHIQDVALDLFDKYEFANVTVEQIAEASDVSPSTLYRYFGTKDRLVLHDEEDRIMVDILIGAIEEGLSLIDAARKIVVAMTPFLGPDNTSLPRRFKYMVSEPTVRAAMLQETQEVAAQVKAEVCRVHGRAPDDLEVALSVSALVNTLVIAADTWQYREFQSDYAEILNDCLDILERGIRL